MIDNLDLYLKFFNNLPLYYFGISLFLFLLGLCSLVLNKDNILKILVSFELMVLANIINFTMGAALHSDMTGQLFVMIILAVAAAEAALGLAVFFAYFKKKKNVSVEDANLLNG